MSIQKGNSRNALKLIAIALSLYIIWVAAIYILEGRIHLFQKVDPIGRMTYFAIANIAIGTVLSAIAIQYLVKAQLVKPEQLGLSKSRLRTTAIIASAAAGGLLYSCFRTQELQSQLLYLMRSCKFCLSQ